MIYRAHLVLVVAAMTAGCGTTALSSRTSNPVIQDFNFRWWSDASTLATTASRRLALMFYRKDAQGHDVLQSCAEPPPDVGETIAKALAAQIELEGGKAGAKAEISAGFASQMATAIAPLMVRSQGLQLMRDSAFALCIDRMNGWIVDPEVYQKIKQDRFNQAVELIKLELPHLALRQKALDAPQLPPVPSLTKPKPKAPAASEPDR